MRKSGLTGDEAYALSKRRGTTGDLGPLKKEISLIKEDTTALQKRQNVLVGSETGNPVSCDDAYSAPLCGLTVYGKSTQDGTPTPDAPVPIVSAGDGGSVAVKVTGRNLLKIRDASQITRGVMVTAKNGLISITGTATANGWAILDIDSFYITANVILSSNIDAPIAGLASPSYTPVLSQGNSAIPSDIINRIIFSVRKGTTYNLTDVRLKLELGSTATAYSPYREQLLALPTPNGLPGIPVTSDGNYTDQNGQQWICDEVDLERGVKVQRVKVLDINDTSLRLHPSSNSYWYVSTSLLDCSLNNTGTKSYKEVMCQKFPVVSQLDETKYSYPIVALYGHVDRVELRFRAPEALYATIEDFRQTIVGTKVYYPLATPVETPLTPAEIAAYKALTAYAPDTVVQASDGAGVKLEYQRDVNIAIKNLEDAIASMTTT